MKIKNSKLKPFIVLALMFGLGLGSFGNPNPGQPGPGTVRNIPMSTPTSSSQTFILLNGAIPITPDMSAEGSGGELMFCIAGYTNWQSEPWTPPAEGDYLLYVGRKDAWARVSDWDVDYVHFTGNVTDPIQGEMQVNSTPYIVHVIFGAP